MRFPAPAPVGVLRSAAQVLDDAIMPFSSRDNSREKGSRDVAKHSDISGDDQESDGEWAAGAGGGGAGSKITRWGGVGC
jgi:hypothetical protein